MARTPCLGLIAVLLLAGCGRSDRIVVGSKNFTEQVILGEIVAQQIERRLGVTVDRKLNLGGTLLAHQALLAGQIDVYPEYTGTALMEILKLPRRATRRLSRIACDPNTSRDGISNGCRRSDSTTPSRWWSTADSRL